MPKHYNGLNSVKIDLASIGICPMCGKRMSGGCEHATPEQIEYTLKLDAAIDAEYEQKRQAREIARDNLWLGDVVIIPTADKVTVIQNGRGSTRYPLVDFTNDEDLRGEMLGNNARSGIIQEPIF